MTVTSPIVSLTKEGVTVAAAGGQVSLFPGWRGPAKVWVKGRGAAYTWGVLAVTATELVFASPAGVHFRAPRAAVQVGWPWWSGRLIAHVRLPNGESHAVAFSRPFPEMPGGDPRATSAAVEVLRAQGVLAVDVPPGRDAGLAFTEIGQVIRDLTDLVVGGRRARAVRALLAAS